MAKEPIIHPKGTLTAAFIKGVPVPEGASRVRVKDSEVVGLECVISRTGRVTFYFAARWGVPGATGARPYRRMAIKGAAGLKEARAKARALRLDIERGQDPIMEAKEAKTRAVERARRPVMTLAQLLDAYGETASRRLKRWSDQRRHLASNFKAHLDLPARNLDTAAVRRMLDKATCRDAPISGRRAFAYLLPVTAWAVSRGHLDDDPCAAIGPQERRRLPKAKSRARVLADDELRALWRVLEARPLDPYAACVRLLLLTGQRRDEVAGMTWGELDLAASGGPLWRLPGTRTKNGKGNDVPLSPEALAVIEALPRRGKGVFTTTTGGPIAGPSGNWSKALKHLQEASGTGGWHYHDLRRTASTLLQRARVAAEVRQRLRNHVSDREDPMRAIYDRYDYSREMRAAVLALARQIRTVVDDVPGGKVVALRDAPT